jgi:hypothetical protein
MLYNVLKSATNSCKKVHFGFVVHEICLVLSVLPLHPVFSLFADNDLRDTLIISLRFRLCLPCLVARCDCIG